MDAMEKQIEAHKYITELWEPCLKALNGELSREEAIRQQLQVMDRYPNVDKPCPFTVFAVYNKYFAPKNLQLGDEAPQSKKWSTDDEITCFLTILLSSEIIFIIIAYWQWLF